MRYEDDPNLLIKYKMNLNRNWYSWKNYDFSFEDDIWFIMVYQILTGENIINSKYENAIKDMQGFQRTKNTYKIPTGNNFKMVESEEEGIASAMIRNYWFGRHYGLIDAAW